MRLPSQGTLNGVTAGACAAMFGYAIYAQLVLGFEPCHLCIFQRVAMIAVGIVLLLAAVHRPGRVGAAVYGSLASLAAMAGLAVAGRHVWIQLQPPGSVPACGAPLDVLFDLLPFQEVVLKVFRGGGECQRADWAFLGLTMPMWLVGVFAFLAVFAVWNNFSRAEAPRPTMPVSNGG